MKIYIYCKNHILTKRFIGIFFKQGAFWRDQRRFALRHLRDFSFGRRFSDLEIDINDELLELVDMIKHGPKHDFEEVNISKSNFQIQIIYNYKF